MRDRVVEMKHESEAHLEEQLIIPERRDVLGDHLYQKVGEILDKLSISPAVLEKITGMLMECGDRDITQLLIDEGRLTSRICMAYSCLTNTADPGDLGSSPDMMETEKQDLGCKLFDEISKIDSSLCAQITGMLMELDCDKLRELLADEGKLKMAVKKSKSALLRTMEEDSNSNRMSVTDQEELGVKSHSNRTSVIDEDDLGEKLYHIIHSVYPSEAGQITGMLLESDAETLQHLLENKDSLWQKVSLARRVLHEYTCT